MNLTVFRERENITEKVIFSGKNVQDLLKQLNINPETVIVVRNDEAITEEETLNDNEQINLLSVISGG